MLNGGDHRFHFVHVEDVARAAIRAAEASSARSYVFNIAGGRQWALHEAVALIRKLIPHARIDIGGGYWHLDRQGPWDLSSAEQELGYHPSRTFEDGIRDYIEWLRHNEY